MAQTDPKAFTEGWIMPLVDSIDEHLDEKQKPKQWNPVGGLVLVAGPFTWPENARGIQAAGWPHCANGTAGKSMCSGMETLYG